VLIVQEVLTVRVLKVLRCSTSTPSTVGTPCTISTGTVSTFCTISIFSTTCL
jgi:hypothetical protein